MAEREGFEPPVPFRVRRFSRPEPSTTRPPLPMQGLRSRPTRWAASLVYNSRVISALGQKAECFRMKFHDFGEMRQKILQAMVAREEMVFVFHAFFLQLIVQGGRSFLKSVIIILAAVEIDSELLQSDCILFRKDKWAVLVPMSDVDRFAEYGGEHSGERRTRARSGVQCVWRFRDKRGALRAQGGEKFWMREGEPQGSVATHGNPADCATGTAGANAIFAFDLRHEFLQKKIAVAHRAIGRIDVEAAAAFRSYDQKVSHLGLVAEN